MKKIYVLDTSVLLTDAKSIFSFKNNDVVIPLKVLDEIDGQKKRQDTVGLNARTIIRSLDKLREKGCLTNGVRLDKGLGKLSVRSHDVSMIPGEWGLKTPDNMIISTALAIKKSEEKRKVILVSNDINMRVKCDAVNLLTSDYKKEKIIEKSDELYTGSTEVVVSGALIEDLHNGQPVELEDELFPNQFVMLVSKQDSKKTALARYLDKNKPLVKVKEYKKKGSAVFNLTARNREQTYALNLLMDPNVPIVTLLGEAGTGKSILALAAGLEQILNYKQYEKMVTIKPIIPIGNDIGYLPGSKEEKLMSWMAPIKDNLEYLCKSQGLNLDDFIKQGIIELEAMTYVRGRSLNNTLILIDECQNLSQHEMKTILTRVGFGSKIICLGSVEQIDNLYVDETSNGLTYAVEKFKKYGLAGHVTLLKGERSEVATLAAKIL